MTSSTFCERPIGRSGEVFAERRMALGRDALDFSRELQIPLRYILALEESAYCDVPMAFTKHWLRSYSQALGLGWETMGNRITAEWERAQRECAVPRSSRRSPALAPISRVRVVAYAAAAAVLLYLGVVISKTFLPPPLAIPGLSTYSETRARHLEADLVTLPGTSIVANGEQLFADRDGYAHVSIALNSGDNVIVLRAKRAHSRERVVEYHIRAQ